MLTTTLIIAAVALLIFLTAYFIIRSWMVRDYRSQMASIIKDDHDALVIFNNYQPSFSRMLWSFKPLKDSKWYPPNLRAAKNRAMLSPEGRKALDKWIKENHKNQTIQS